MSSRVIVALSGGVDSGVDSSVALLKVLGAGATRSFLTL